MSVKTRRLAWEATTVFLTFAILILLILPFLWIILASFRPLSQLLVSDLTLFTSEMSFANYRRLFDTGFLVKVRNSMVVCLTATACTILITLPAAYSFSRKRFFGRNWLLILVIFTQLFPFVILINPIFVNFFRWGLIDSHFGLILAYISITTPLTLYLLIGHIDAIPKELDEAAVIDGCTTLGVIFRIIFPVIVPGVVATAITIFTMAWNEYLLALTLITQQNLQTVPLGIANFMGEFSVQWDMVMAASVVATLPTFFIFLFFQRYLVSGLTAGAVKL